jgi:threonine-phosphate decarboxylase
MLFGHGNDIYKYKETVIADFSSNVWYKGMQESLIRHLQDKVSNIVHYPEPDAGKLSKKIADLHGLGHQNILVTNGATEAFYLLAQLNAGLNSYIVYPGFAEYEDACKIYNHKLHYLCNVEFHAEISLKQHAMVWIGNPNNPDGKVISKENILTLCKNNPDTIFIVDEAYAELCWKFDSVIHPVNKLNNLIVVRSLTKAFAIPGIRLGYMVAPVKIIEKAKTVKMPWSVNMPAIEAGNFILADYYNMLPEKNIVAKESKTLQKELACIPGIKIHPSDCNYFLGSIENGKACDLKQFLLKSYGLLIRDASNFRGLNVSYFRIAIQKPEFNILLINAIKQWIRNNKACQNFTK